MPGKESVVAEIRTIVDLGKDWQYESDTETLGLAYAFRPIILPGEWQGPTHGGVFARISCWLSDYLTYLL